jgi:Transposase DDE domain group 1
MENPIKECQLDLYADRTSAQTLRANQLRLWFASMAYATGAGMEETKCLKPPDSGHELGDRASVQAATLSERRASLT